MLATNSFNFHSKEENISDVEFEITYNKCNYSLIQI